MDKGVAAAQRSFPERARSIERLAASDDDFRDLCTDLADAQAALLHWEISIEPLREQRCAEYAEMVHSLSVEIETALNQADVIPFDIRRQKPHT
ncbi:hypothetical protein J2X72_003444 [Phyllobacterium sp. 1468]|uniref:hypothetical protein n=1 Tax=Phyllobacterium sp. 1468 TaxID=2817759 RepID=UPI00285DEF7B|nr:hypothetical protein [Phyllobacterium sp. 1468]MDR6634634.1 hypothetical protein [Phyllobacterium sp. 1468]